MLCRDSSYEGLYGTNYKVDDYVMRLRSDFSTEQIDIPIHPKRRALEPVVDLNGGLWIPSRDSGIIHINHRGIVKPYNPRTSILPWDVFNIAIGPDGSKWISTLQGIYAIRDVYPLCGARDAGSRRALPLYAACPTPNIELYDTSQTIGDGLMRWRWTLPGGDSLSGRRVRVHFSLAGTYRIALRVTDSNHCYSDTALYLTITDGGRIEARDSLLRGCAPVALQARQFAPPGIAAGPLRWLSPAGDTLAGPTPRTAGPGRYTALTYFGACLATDTVRVIQPDTVRLGLDFYTLPAGAPALLYDSTTTTFPFGQPLLARVQGPQAAGAYTSWRWQPAGQAAGAAEQFYPQGFADAALVRAWAKALADSCPALARRRVPKAPPIQPPLPAIELPNVVTPNGDGLNDALLPVGYTAWPQGTQLRIYNRWGRLVHEGATPWPQADTPAGLYFALAEPAGKPALRGWVEVER